MLQLARNHEGRGQYFRYELTLGQRKAVSSVLVDQMTQALFYQPLSKM